MSDVLVDIAKGVARVTLNRPATLNAFTIGMHRALLDALDRAEAESARVMVLTGAGRAFCAGQDLGERDTAGDAALDLGANIEKWYNPLVRRLTRVPFPLIAAVNGVAAGAGANLALAADIVIAKESARFIQSFATIGLLPDSGGTWRLPRLIGEARALAIAMTGTPVEARQAAEWGMIWKAVPDETFEQEVDASAAAFADAPTAGMVATARAIRGAWDRDLDEQLDHERDTQRRLGLTADYREGVEAFKAKRPPVFKGK